ncbi:MAG: hypothetical protein WKF73_11485 [Nocardioidaceae bacterium]
MKVTVVVAVHRGTVWVSIDPFFAFEAILELEHVVSLIDMLGQAVREAQHYENEDVS